MRNTSELRGGYFGRELESDIFGAVKPAKGFKEFYKKVARSDGYVAYEDAIRLVRDFTMQDGKNPDKEFLNDLRLEIGDILGFDEDDMENLFLFSAVGTPIDRFHSVDAFLELDIDDDNGPLRVTMDATLNTKKLEGGYRSDVIVGDIPDPSSDEYLNSVEWYAHLVVDQIQKMASERKNRI
ncbi:hypothetical protein KJ766_03220 [Patescibacteria group bacterium]|nr:hypothetical protein [Patescibacteria group bacterium]